MWHFSPQTNKNSLRTKEVDKENMMCSPMCTAPRRVQKWWKVEGKCGSISNSLVCFTKYLDFIFLNNSLQSGGTHCRAYANWFRENQTSISIYIFSSPFNFECSLLNIYIYIFMCNLQRKIYKLGPYSEFLLDVVHNQDVKTQGIS